MKNTRLMLCAVMLFAVSQVGIVYAEEEAAETETIETIEVELETVETIEVDEEILEEMIIEEEIIEEEVVEEIIDAPTE